MPDEDLTSASRTDADQHVAWYFGNIRSIDDRLSRTNRLIWENLCGLSESRT